jgi:AAA domain
MLQILSCPRHRRRGGSRHRVPAALRVPRAGRVLLYAAEDALHIVRQRLEGICAASGVALADLDIQVITASTLRLDLEADRRRLEATVAKLRPRLLELDPFVRLHRVDENASGEVAPLLAWLRELQRRYDVAIIVVHHATEGAGRIRGGQALRGSSEFHAWGDSNLYLRRDGDPNGGKISSAGYSSAGCFPAEPASASPDNSHGIRSNLLRQAV